MSTMLGKMGVKLTGSINQIVEAESKLSGMERRSKGEMTRRLLAVAEVELRTCPLSWDCFGVEDDMGSFVAEPAVIGRHFWNPFPSVSLYL